MRVSFILLYLLWLLPGASASEIPVLADPRLEITLFAEHPDIVTPIGMAIDSHDRIYVIESHTHSPPRDYPGPKTDWIKVFQDTNNDGKPDSIRKFADGFVDAMNLAISPEGELIVACAREVWALHDRDQDGVSESRTRLLELRTSNNYSHSALLGITIGPDGWMYLSRGNNGSARYTLVGTDRSQVAGFGDGGNIIRCRPDGSKLEEFATGFWNPFDLKFDSYGRLICVDNDPDARGPNRLLHIVEKGDYGYRSIYGGGGNHPYQGWDGDLAGTLPYAAGTGEAPSGVIDCNRAAFPDDYRDNYLVTVWNENNLVRFIPKSAGLSLTATNAIFLQGGQDFRPVALDADSRGNLFITDWVKVDYPNHGHGRIWRVAAKAGVDTSPPRSLREPPLHNPAGVEFASLAEPGIELARLHAALAGADPFARHAAILSLSRTPARAREALLHAEPKIRLGGLLALRLAGLSPETHLPNLLTDPDETVRRAALIRVGEEGLVEFADRLHSAIAFDNLSTTLFETWLATHELLHPAFLSGRNSPSVDRANRIPRHLDATLLETIILDDALPLRVRALALARLDSPRAEFMRKIEKLARTGPPALQREAIRTLAASDAGYDDLLEEMAFDSEQEANIRAEALLALGGRPLDNPARFLPLLSSEHPAVRIETLRALRLHVDDPDVRKHFDKLWKDRDAASWGKSFMEQLGFALSSQVEPPVSKRPSTLAEWQTALAEGGDPLAGERVFRSSQTQCAACHRVNNRGRAVGPELSNIAQSLSREQIVHSILKPSDQFAPQYQAWFVELKNDEYHQGFQLDHKDRGAIELYTTEGRTRRFEGEEILRYGILPNSLMPDGLEAAMTVGEFRDLIAFLASLK